MDNKKIKYENFLDLENLKFSISFTSIFTLYFESLKEYVIERVEYFFVTGFSKENDKIKIIKSEKYKTDVLGLKTNKNQKVFELSLLWLVKQEAITKEEYNLIIEVRNKRNIYTHELIDIIGRRIEEADILLFTKLVTIHKKLDNWWIVNIEIPTSGIDCSNITQKDLNDSYTINTILLGCIANIIIKNDDSSYNELKELLRKNNL